MALLTPLALPPLQSQCPRRACRPRAGPPPTPAPPSLPHAAAHPTQTLRAKVQQLLPRVWSDPGQAPEPMLDIAGHPSSYHAPVPAPHRSLPLGLGAELAAVPALPMTGGPPEAVLAWGQRAASALLETRRVPCTQRHRPAAPRPKSLEADIPGTLHPEAASFLPPSKSTSTALTLGEGTLQTDAQQSSHRLNPVSTLEEEHLSQAFRNQLTRI